MAIVLLLLASAVVAATPAPDAAPGPSAVTVGTDAEESAALTSQEEATVTVRGRVLLANGEPAVNHSVAAFDRSGEHHHVGNRTDEDGYFELRGLVADHRYTLTYFAANTTTIAATFPTDGSPDLYVYDTVAVARDTSIGTIRLPDAHPVEVRVVNESDKPVKGVYVAIDHHHNDTVGRWADVTSADGYVKDGAGSAEMEVVGEVSILVEPSDERYVREEYRRNLTVTGPESVTVTLAEREVTPTPEPTPIPDRGNGGGDGTGADGFGADPGAIAAIVVLVVLLGGSYVLLR